MLEETCTQKRVSRTRTQTCSNNKTSDRTFLKVESGIVSAAKAQLHRNPSPRRHAMRVFCAGALPAGLGSMKAVRPPGGPNPNPSRRPVPAGGWPWGRYPGRCLAMGCYKIGKGVRLGKGV